MAKPRTRTKSRKNLSSSLSTSIPASAPPKEPSTEQPISADLASDKVPPYDRRLLVRPHSATSPLINLVALASLFMVLGVLARYEVDDRATQFWSVILAIALPVALLEYVRFGNRLGGPRPANQAGQVVRVAIKLIGLAASIGALALSYWLFPYFRNGDASLVYELFSAVAVPLAIATPVYFWMVDGRMAQPQDGYYAAGLAALGRWAEVDKDEFWQHARAWLIKIFFFQYISSVLLPYVRWALALDPLKEITGSTFGFMNVFIDSVWLVDVAFSATGYFVCLRALDSHNRSADPTALGWMVCMLCYGPFYVMLINSFLPYDDNYYWGHWLHDTPLLKALWALPIVLLLGNYACASMQFGIRFSNLTHRGIVTSGPFRWTKHPQYISKNVAWWFLSVPFIHEAGWLEGLRHCFLLLGFNFIFYLRAKTEERHLSFDPTYRVYAAWIAEHGLIARLKRKVRVPGGRGK